MDDLIEKPPIPCGHCGYEKQVTAYVTDAFMRRHKMVIPCPLCAPAALRARKEEE